MTMSATAKKRATYDDVLAAPEHVVAELLGGVLEVSPRPRKPHAAAASALGEELGPPFKRGRGGPGGWIILDESEIHLGEDVVVPDFAGWRRDRMPALVDDEARWVLIATHGGDERVRAEPFDAVELDLAILWADVVPGPEGSG